MEGVHRRGVWSLLGMPGSYIHKIQFTQITGILRLMGKPHVGHAPCGSACHADRIDASGAAAFPKAVAPSGMVVDRNTVYRLHSGLHKTVLTDFPDRAGLMSWLSPGMTAPGLVNKKGKTCTY